MLQDKSNVADMALNAAGFMGTLLLNATPWVLLSGFAGLLLAIFLIVFIAKRQLLTRHTAAWNFMAKLGYLIILVALPFGAGALGGLYGVHTKVDAEVDAGLRPILAARMPQLRIYVANELRRVGDTQSVHIDVILKPLKSTFNYAPTSGGLWERTKSYWVNDVVVNPAFSLIGEVMQDKLIDTLGGSAVAGSKEGPDARHGQRRRQEVRQ